MSINDTQQFLRGLRLQGVEPIDPENPIWEKIYYHTHDLFNESPIMCPAFFEKVGTLNVPAAPWVRTLYQWALNNKVQTVPILGPVLQHPKVREQVESYIIGMLHETTAVLNVLSPHIEALLQYGTLSAHLSKELNKQFNQAHSSEYESAWISFYSGEIPRVKDLSWSQAASLFRAIYPTTFNNMSVSQNEDNHDMQSNQHYRMDLILAAYLHSDYRSAHVFMDAHLSSVRMDEPDAVTCVFWVVVKNYVHDHPDDSIGIILKRWMQGYPEFDTFIHNQSSLLIGMGFDDPIACGMMLHQLLSYKSLPLELTTSFEYCE